MRNIDLRLSDVGENVQARESSYGDQLPQQVQLVA
jgi:hypothetical protein